jgi:glycosyltransferase involved in cell wall biosynthesis
MPSSTTVIIPVRNGAEFIAEAIASALVQLGGTDEILVIDDASTDDTRSVVTAIHDPRVRLLEGSGRGVSSARNIGLAAAKGDFIAFLDHDDLWPSSRHAVMLKALLDNPDIDAIYGRMRVQFEPGAQEPERFRAMEGKHVPDISVCNGLFRRRIVERAGPFDENLYFGEDTDYSLRLKEAGLRLDLCDVDGLIYRRHPGNATNDPKRREDGVVDVIMRKIARRRVTGTGGKN